MVLAGSLTFSGNHKGSAAGAGAAARDQDAASVVQPLATAPDAAPFVIPESATVLAEQPPVLPPAAPLETAPVQTPVPPLPPVAPPTTATPRPPTPVPPRPTATSAPAPPAAAVGLGGMDQELLNSHNAERGKAGLAPLRVDGALVTVARQRANDMAAKNYFSHTSPTGETAFVLLNRAGYAYGTAGENIARNNYPDAQAAGVAMNGFMNSPSHRVNIMDGRFRNVGIASVTGRDGMKYFAVIFSGS